MDCGPSPTDSLGLRVGAIFVILATSLVGALFPVVAKRVPALRRMIPPFVFEFAKFFGSGVILATGFIHLLSPASSELGLTESLGGCLDDAWGAYPYAFAICLTSLFSMFLLHIVSLRIGTARLAKLGMVDSDGSTSTVNVGNKDAKPDETVLEGGSDEEKCPVGRTPESAAFRDASEANPASTQLLAVAILEFGVVFHSIIIGLTLSVSSPEQYNVLFIVIIFHQAFEGLGLGTRLAFLKLPREWRYVPFIGAIFYACVTPLGMAIGLAARETIAIGSANASIAAGVLDSVSSGILIYTSTVSLMAQEFIFNKYYHTCSWWRLWFAVGCFATGAGIMALLGKWI